MKKLILYSILLLNITFLLAKSKIAIIDLDGKGISPVDAAAITDFLRSDIVKTNKFIVIDRTNMDKILQEQNFQQTGCTNQECAVKIGKLLNVEKMIVGSVNKLGSMYFINVNIVNVQSGIIESAYDDECQRLEDMRKTTKILTTKIINAKPESIPNNETGSLFIQSEPSEAIIFVDNKRIEKLTPATIDNLSIGHHSIKLIKNDFEAIKDVEIFKDDFVKINVHLQKMKCKLKIKTEPFEAKVYIDNTYKGNTPITISDVIVGHHNLKITKNGYLDYTKLLNIKSDFENSVDIELVKSGYLSIHTEPKNVKIYLDSDNIDYDNNDNIALKIGEYKLKLEKPDYKTKEIKIKINHNEKTIVNEKLEYLYSILNICSDPDKANCYLNNQQIGITPVRLNKINPDKYNLKISKDNYIDYYTAIQLNKGEIKNIDISLEKTKEYKRKTLFRITGVSSLIVGTVFTILAYNSNNNLNQSIEEYNNAIDKSTVDTKHDEMISYNNKLKIYSILAGVTSFAGGIQIVIGW